MITDEVRAAFYDGRRSSVYPLVVNDVVRVKKGRMSGALAAVIAVQSPAPAVSYLVEYGDGTDEVMPFSELERTEPNKAPEPTPGKCPASSHSLPPGAARP